MRKHVRGTAYRVGFTLIELIIVLLVLASLAALIVPTLGFVKDQADTSLSANGAQQVLNNLEQFKAATGRYPNRLDTLVDETGAAYAPVYSIGGPGNPYIGSVQDSSGGNFFYYFMANGGGLSEVSVHDSTNVEGASGFDPNAPGTTTPLDSSTQLVIAQEGESYTGKRGAIISTCFPNQDPNDAAAGRATIPDGHTLVFMGVGANNSAVGATMTQAPLSPEKSAFDENQYDRFIAVFDVSGGGPNFRGQVKLKAVLDPQFNVVARNIAAYKSSTPGDDFGQSSTGTP
ncbi:MAG: prepilin-type N-terminal cleavage/methylation domain-containing protein [Pirellulales bacterium]|nr:prepilin-type N-terminal cleavage/methylation domain-containing protein [Pirellulales bacterium]